MVVKYVLMLFVNKQNNFKIPEAGIDINKYRAYKCNYFSYVKHTDMILRNMFYYANNQRYLTVFNYKNISSFMHISFMLKYLTRRAGV